MRASPCGSNGKASAYNAGDLGSIPGSERSPGEGNGNLLQYSSLEKSHGWKSLVGYSLWGHKELDTTEQLHLFTRFIVALTTALWGMGVVPPVTQDNKPKAWRGLDSPQLSLGKRQREPHLQVLLVQRPHAISWVSLEHGRGCLVSM